MRHTEDINDNEIRIIGETQESIKPAKGKWLVAAIIAAVAIIAVIVVLLTHRSPDGGEEPEVVSIFEPQPEAAILPHPLEEWLYGQDSIKTTGTATKDTTVNDIAIRIYLPLNATPALQIGTRPLRDKTVILAFQAADIRADNKKIVGAFVEKGKPIAWGLSKKGYCAILNDSIHIGMADNSPLFEEATDCGGYFFRQYPLVADGAVQESELKSQAVRRALCEVDEHICVVETQDRSSMHDFSVLLADLGVRNAIYLIGSDAMGTFTDLEGKRTAIGNHVEHTYKNINFIYWSER